MTLHIGFDGLFLEEPYTGSGQYARGLLRALLRRADLRVTILRPEPAPPVALEATTGEAVVGRRPPVALRSSRPRKVWWEQIGLPAAAAQGDVDVIHVPYFAAPLRPGRPLVVTIHDIIPLLLPLYAGSAAMRLYLRVVSQAVRGAAAVVTDSDAARRDILVHLGLEPARVSRVWLAADERYHPGTMPATAASDTVLARLGIRPPFLLNTGGFDARKNLPFLMRAVAQATRTRPDWQLVVIGRPHTGNSQLYPPLEPLLAETGLTDRTIFTGFIPDDDKVVLYQRAGLVVLPTLYEGFGLPALEALACGAPLLASDRSSLPEVVGRAGVLADPTNLARFAALLADLLDNPGERARLSRAGPAQAAQFSWDATAEQTVAVYRRAITTPRPEQSTHSRGARPA